jgi:8-oxo-dGTP pyrophosphatase MutT (NUDIX family)
MSLLDRVRACHGWRPEAYRPWHVGRTLVGRVRHDLAERLRDFPDVFEVSDRAVALRAGLDDFAGRSDAVDGVVRDLAEDAEVGRYRGEAYPVVPLWGDAPLLKMDRGAVPDFGVRGYGVHLNGVVETPDGLKMWVGKRSMAKPTGAGKLDHLVAGGQPHGIGVRDNLIKEAAEEAALPAALVRRAAAVGAVSYRCERAEGLRDDVLFCYDLVLPVDFEPHNTDGEVDWFELWPMEKVAARIAETDDFKFNVALVIVDFMVRRGLLGPDDPDYMAIVDGLRLAD